MPTATYKYGKMLSKVLDDTVPTAAIRPEVVVVEKSIFDFFCDY